MPDTVDIDAIIISMRATLRELNNQLAKLHLADAAVKVVSWDQNRNTVKQPPCVSINITFPVEQER